MPDAIDFTGEFIGKRRLQQKDPHASMDHAYRELYEGPTIGGLPCPTHPTGLAFPAHQTCLTYQAHPTY